MSMCPAIMARIARLKQSSSSPTSIAPRGVLRPRSLVHSMFLGMFLCVALAWFHRWKHLVVVVGSPEGSSSEQSADAEAQEMLLRRKTILQQQRTHLVSNHHNRTKHNITRYKANFTIPPFLNLNDKTYPRIPHQILFTHKTNLLRAKKADPKEQQFYLDNIMRTIRMYANFWKNETVSIWFLDNQECERVLRKVEPRLIPYFLHESVEGKFKGDMCRAAALFLKGGYYFDADMKALKPVRLDPNTTFSSAKSSQGFFNSYMASAPGNMVVRESLDIMLRYYMNGTHEKDANRRKWGGARPYSDDMDELDDGDDDEDEDKEDDKDEDEDEYNDRKFGIRGDGVDEEDDDEEFEVEEEIEMAISTAIYWIKERGLVGPYSLWGAYEAELRRQQFELEQMNCEGGYMDDFDDLEPLSMMSAAARRAARRNDDYVDSDSEEEDEDEDSNKKDIKRVGEKEEEDEDDEPKCDLPPETIRRRFFVVEDAQMMHEENFDEGNLMRRKQFPQLKYQDDGDGPNCNYVIHNQKQVFFFARFVGAGGHGHCDFPKSYYKKLEEERQKRLNSTRSEPKPLRAVQPQLPRNVKLFRFSHLTRTSES
mmetsp:Transcript_9037/g.25044  ORF Transcript_9037/g.25044 Transcript_9037/m.25044 type:complete len:595 (-) Transcript_9037:77-1861(-)